ncbi:radical SAM protein [bacterium]|nr:radical SAM protein [candidate division CSSED10-310 bacterium]
MSTRRQVVILLNPPANDIAIRDNYCSKISQAAYINHPIDLLIQSGFLSEHFEIKVIDAIVERLTVGKCLDRLVDSQPAAVFCLAGNATWPEDQKFIQSIKRRLPDVKLICSGDVFLESPMEFFESVPGIDAVLTDYTSNGLMQYLTGSSSQCDNLVFRDENGVVRDHRKPIESNGIVRFPMPCHHLFMNLDYRYPFVKSRRFATMITEFGCPFHCSFCVMGTLGCKRRSISDVIDELGVLKSLGVRDVFFLDQSFGSDQSRNIELCKMIHRTRPELRWLCFSRVDLVNEPILNLMKASGCHTIIFGVESANQTLLQKYRKGYTPEMVRNILYLAEKTGIRTVATFLLGLPGETWDSAMETIDFAESLPCTYASLNIAVPRMGTDMRQYALEKGYFDPGNQHFDQSGTEIIMSTDTLDSEQLKELKKIAVRRLYLNPRRIARVLKSIRTIDELGIHIREGCELICRYMRKKKL